MSKPSTPTEPHTTTAGASVSADDFPEVAEGADLEFDCPSCAQTTAARFYGPCLDCVERMRSQLSGDARDVDVADYEPKMNVTPNAVATKD